MLRAASAAEQSCWVTALHDYMEEWNDYRQKSLNSSIRHREEDRKIFADQANRSGYESKEDYD